VGGGLIVRAGAKADDAVDAISKVNNMTEFFKDTPLGMEIVKLTNETNFKFQGTRIYTMIKKSSNKYLKKGDYFYLDNFHKDHLEIYNSDGKVKAVLNLDGSYNKLKTEKVLKENREIKVN
ncbi:MAG TPA: hypothetical protein PLE30_11185, partial [Candidatus Kapabacteria bacterium]|nr:hypothetical protein [Candidatus Kapabacteria bacterium]